MNDIHNMPIEEPDRAAGHETRDVDLRGILLFAGILAAVTAVILVALYFLMMYLSAQANRTDPRLSPLVDRQQAPPPPTLQAKPALDYNTFLADQIRETSTYGWIDRERGIARIPVERAMELLVERGLPPTGREQPKTGGAATAQIPSGGRASDDASKSTKDPSQPRGSEQTP